MTSAAAAEVPAVPGEDIGPLMMRAACHSPAHDIEMLILLKYSVDGQDVRVSHGGLDEELFTQGLHCLGISGFAVIHLRRRLYMPLGKITISVTRRNQNMVLAFRGNGGLMEAAISLTLRAHFCPVMTSMTANTLAERPPI